MAYQVLYSSKANADLENLEYTISKRIVKKIYFYSLQENPFRFAKKLHDPEIGTYRFRIGDYRAIFDVNHVGKIFILHILRIKHRKEIYQPEN